MVTGQINVCVNYGEQVARLVLVVVAGSGPSHFGRNWLKYLQLDWKCIATVKSPPAGTLKNLLHEYDSLFKDELGTVTSCTQSHSQSTARCYSQTTSCSLCNQRGYWR